MEENKTNANRNTTAYRATKQLDLTQQQQRNAAKHERVGGQRAAHPAIYLNTRYHKLLRRAVRIWKMPVPIMNFTGSSRPKPRNFREQLKRVETFRNRRGDNLKPTACSVRDLQLCSSGTDSSSSPSSSSSSSGSPCRRSAPRRTRRYRKQMQWYRILTNNKRRKQREKLRRLEGRPSPAASCCVKGSSERQEDRRDSSSSQSTPEIPAPTRKTSRRLWRRQLDSSSSDSSPMTADPDRQTKNTFSSAEESKTEFDSNLSKEASEQKHVNVKLAVQTDEEQTPRTSKREDQISPHLQPDSDRQIFKDGHREDIKQQSISRQIRTASCLSSHTLADSPRPKSCVKWKNVLLQRAQGSAAAPDESRYRTHQSWSRFTRADRSSPEGGSPADRPDERNHTLRWSTVLPETR